MGRAQTAQPAFGTWLRGQLDERGWGVRTLARKMNPEQPEISRRALNRYMKGSFPSNGNRALIAQGLGISEADMPGAARSGDDDEDEAEPMLHDAFNLFVDLLGQIQDAKKDQRQRAVA